MPYREPTLHPPTRPAWDAERLGLVFEAALDRVAVVFDRVASRLDQRATFSVRLLSLLVAGVVLGVLAGAVVRAVTAP